MILDPDGRQVWVPDFMAPSPPPPPTMPEESNWDFAKGALGGDAWRQLGADARDAFAPALDAVPLDAAQRALSEKIAPPRTDAARIGQSSAPLGTVGQIGQAQAPSVGGAAPSMGRGVPTFNDQDREDLNGGPPLSASAQDAAVALKGVLGGAAGSVGGAAGGAAAGPGGLTENARARDAAAQAAYARTPDGQIEQATRAAAGEVSGQAQNATQQGELEGQQGEAIAMAKQQGLLRAEEAQKRADAWQQHWQAQKVDAAKKIETAISAEAAYKVDDNRRYSKMGTGAKIGFWISAALSGLGDALQHKSGPNMVLNMMTEAIKDDVASQWREKENLGKGIGTAKGRLDNFRQMADDSSQAEQLHIATEYKKTADQVEAVASKYAGPEAKLRAAQVASALRVQAEQIVGSAAEQKIAREQRKAELANQTAQVRIAGGHLALQGRQFEYAKKHDADVLQLEAAKLDQAYQAAGAKGRADQAKFISEHGIGGTTVAVMGDDGKPVTGPDGRPQLKQAVIVAPYASSEKLKELQTQKAAADTIVNIMDETIRLRERYGWGSELWKSKEFQEMKGNWAALKLELKDLAKLGVIAGPDEALMNDFLGGADPTSVRDPLAGMQNARNNVTLKYTSSLRSVGATDERGQPLTYAPPQQHYAAPVGTPEDLAFKDSIQEAGPLKAAQAVIDPNATPLDRYEQSETGVTKAQRTTIADLVQKANDPKASQAKRDAATAMLQRGAESAGSPALREMYGTALTSSTMESIPMSKD